MPQYVLIGKKKVRVPLAIESAGGDTLEEWLKKQQPKPKPEKKEE